MSAQTIFMNIPDINGDATAKGYEKWIKVESLSHSAHTVVVTEPGVISNRVQGLPRVGEFHLTLFGHRSKVDLMTHLYEKTCFPEVKIHVCTVRKDGYTPVMEYILKDAIISNRSFTVDNITHAPIVALSLNTTEITERFTNPDGDGSPNAATYSLEKATMG